MTAAAQSDKSPTTHVMSVAKFERFFRIAAGLRQARGRAARIADGFAISDPDWESNSGHYRVRIDNEWIDVPDDAVITEPNRAGRTMVWPIKGSLGTSICCFMPGSMT
jgi:hypothetical protein